MGRHQKSLGPPASLREMRSGKIQQRRRKKKKKKKKNNNNNNKTKKKNNHNNNIIIIIITIIIIIIIIMMLLWLFFSKTLTPKSKKLDDIQQMFVFVCSVFQGQTELKYYLPSGRWYHFYSVSISQLMTIIIIIIIMTTQ